jgi:hypothetical protein
MEAEVQFCTPVDFNPEVRLDAFIIPASDKDKDSA